MCAEEIELLEHEDDALGLLVARLEALQQEGKILGERAEHFAIGCILQAHLHRDRFQCDAIVRVQIAVEVHDECVVHKRFILQQIREHGIDELQVGGSSKRHCLGIANDTGLTVVFPAPRGPIKSNEFDSPISAVRCSS